MEICNQPFIVVVASWMRLREIEVLVYQQLRDQIYTEGRFRIMETENSAKITKKEKLKRFKEYITKHKPYQLRFTDQEGRCGLCCKIQKSMVLKGEAEFVCNGCEDKLDPDEPIFWMLRPYQLKICIDWDSSLSFTAP